MIYQEGDVYPAEMPAPLRPRHSSLRSHTYQLPDQFFLDRDELPLSPNGQMHLFFFQFRNVSFMFFYFQQSAQ